MSEKLGLDSEVHELKLGSSFTSNSPVAFHSIRYDFKPASVDTARASSVEVNSGHSVTVEVPHVEGSGTSHTVYKGNKRPCQKECVLIIDHKTGEITLERLASDIRLKKTRQEGSSRGPPASRPLTPVEKQKVPSPPKKKVQLEEKQPASVAMEELSVGKMDAKESSASPQVAEMADSDSSSGTSDSDSETQHSDHEKENPVTSSKTAVPDRPPFHSTLSEDLQLSDTSGSDSD